MVEQIDWMAASAAAMTSSEFFGTPSTAHGGGFGGPSFSLPATTVFTWTGIVLVVDGGFMASFSDLCHVVESAKAARSLARHWPGLTAIRSVQPGWGGMMEPEAFDGRGALGENVSSRAITTFGRLSELVRGGETPSSARGRPSSPLLRGGRQSLAISASIASFSSIWRASRAALNFTVVVFFRTSGPMR